MTTDRPPISTDAAAGDPVAALERIVHLLDRGLASGRKVQAFVRAAKVAAEQDPAELVALTKAGRVKELPGIGDVTGKVIEEAVAGEVPTYLTKVEAETVIDLSEAAARIRSALRGDCHAHSTWSDGGASIESMARTAQALGHDYLVMTDHSPRLTVAHGLSPDRLREQLDVIEELNHELAPFRVLTGMEVDILEDGSLDLPDDLLARLDVVVASVHSKFRLDREAQTRRLVLAAANPHVDILGHLSNRKLSNEYASRPTEDDVVRAPIVFDPELVFAACARFDTAVEINCRPERLDPPQTQLELAVQWGCVFAVDTDAHATGQLEWQAHGCEKAARAGVDPDRIVNTWDLDRLLAWAGDHPSGW